MCDFFKFFKILLVHIYDMYTISLYTNTWQNSNYFGFRSAMGPFVSLRPLFLSRLVHSEKQHASSGNELLFSDDLHYTATPFGVDHWSRHMYDRIVS
jgi:hypothetical protein